MNNLILSTLATFGFSALIVDYDGPGEVFVKLRAKVKLFRCVVCLSVWVAPIILGLIAYQQMWVIYTLATVGVIILIERTI